ncbi:unnamed protein product [Rotaria sordida]|uniref:Uncharacterized protein n=1 Tax=Rotaria sordida TaxID=392033 RepID=A0A815INK0_9BILA|nr:unnamed protein product [Rotaria sordida]CAF3883035.1 unnamed protein product [Rotaria sordida]
MAKTNAIHRLRRFLFTKIGDSGSKYKQTADRGSQLFVHIGETATNKPVESPVLAAFNTASKIISAAGDVITAPAVWLKEMQKNWVIYLVAAAIILLYLVFLYCVIRYYFSRSNNLATTNLIKRAAGIDRENDILQGQAVVSPGKLLSALPIPSIDLKI